MTPEKREKLESAEWKVGDASDFLEASIELIQGDCLEKLKEIEDQSVDLVLEEFRRDDYYIFKKK